MRTGLAVKCPKCTYELLFWNEFVDGKAKQLPAYTCPKCKSQVGFEGDNIPYIIKQESSGKYN